jgi:hypothetical protein
METTKRYEVRAVGGVPAKRAPAELLAGYDSFEAAAAVAAREANRFPRGTCVLDTETGLVDYGVGAKGVMYRGDCSVVGCHNEQLSGGPDFVCADHVGTGPTPKAGIVTVLALLVSLAFGACHATAPAAAPVETVGTLTASYGSVMSAPVAPSTDLSPGFQAVGTDADDDAPAVAAGAGEVVEAPGVAVKQAHGF